MGVRSALAGTLTRAAKAVAPASALITPELSEPQAMADAARDVSQMTMDHVFAPGEPVGPYDGYSRQPRGYNFETGYNIATRPRTHERVSFETLRGLIESYDVAQICIWHKIDTLRGLRWKLLAADGYSGDVTGAVDQGMQVMGKPDGIHGFRTWFGKWFYDVLAYDAAPLYRLRNRAGKVVGLMPFDGTSLAPLLDYWGNPPQEPAEAYVQYVNGLPWNWLTRADVIYEPFRAVNNSPYGKAPIEAIMLNVNTDIRFQLHFLQRFTDGNIPEAFASAPESWSPEQIEQWQGLWDSFMYGDQARKSQIRWMPGGSTIMWSNEKDFTDAFSLFLMRKTCAAYHQVPTDLGFTETSNYSTGESQSDVQHKVGELPPMEYSEEILSRFFYDDLRLPIKFEWDRGEDQDDRLVQAQADDVYIKNGSVGTEEIRELRYGLPKSARPVPRFIFSERGGPVPLNALMAVGGDIDPETGAPTEGAVLPREAFAPIEGVESNPPLVSPPLAEIEYGPSALPPAGPPQPGTVAKEDVGITSETGLYGYDGPGDEDDEDDEAAVAKELATFRRFARSRQRSGEWRDFRFDAVSAGQARRLNAEGRQAVSKQAAPGLTSRSGMISLDVPDGLISPLPGGLDDFHITVVYLGPDVDEATLKHACERAGVAAAAMPGPLTGTVSGVGAFPPSDGSDGKVPVWAAVALPGAERLRDALADLSASEHKDWLPHVTLAYVDEGDPLPDPLDPVPVTFTHLSVHCGDDVGRFPLGGQDVAKAADAAPKVRKPRKHWPGWDHDQAAADYWAPLLAAALAKSLSAAQARQVAAAYLAAFPGEQSGQGKKLAVEAAAAWLASQGLDLAAVVALFLPGVTADGWLIGAAAAAALTDGTRVQLGGWTPGNEDKARQRAEALGLGAGFAEAVSGAAREAERVAGGWLTALGRALVDGAAGGLTAAEIAALLRSALGDSGNALKALLDLLTAAAGAAARALYLSRQVQMVEWVCESGNPCPACEMNQDQGPIPADGVFESGDASPPVHPNCACAVIPA